MVVASSIGIATSAALSTSMGDVVDTPERSVEPMAAYALLIRMSKSSLEISFFSKALLRVRIVAYISSFWDDEGECVVGKVAGGVMMGCMSCGVVAVRGVSIGGIAAVAMECSD